MSMHTIQLGPWEIIRETEPIPVMSNLPERDEQWRFIDDAGHGHFWQNGYPTLKTVDVDCYCDAVDEDHTVSHFECPHCSETIQPGTKPPSPFPTYLAGPTTFRLIHDDGRVRREYLILSQSDAAALAADPISAIARISAEQEPVNVEWWT